MNASFPKLVGCPVPLQLAPMPRICTVELAAAVAEAGGLGMISGVMLPPEALEAELAALGATTRGAVGVNFLMPFLDPAGLEVAARSARVVECFYGEPQRGLVERIHAGGALAGWQVGSREEALTAAACGCDFVVAQGTEAGGHVRGHQRLAELLAQVVPAVDIPVLAAGGIADARDVAAALAAGAAAVRVGTRFVAATESGAHPDYVRALLQARGEDTCLTETFSVLWPHAPHRVLRSCIEAAEACTEDPVGKVRFGDAAIPIARFSPMSPTRDTAGRIDAMALYAGEGVGRVTRVQPAAEIVAELFPA